MQFLESLGKDESRGRKNWILASLQIDFVAETFFGNDVMAGDRVPGGQQFADVYLRNDAVGKLTVKGKAVLVFSWR